MIMMMMMRLEFSRIIEHRFRHNFDCLDPVCLCGITNEGSEHFLQHCPIFEEARRGLLVSLSDIPALDIPGLDTQSLWHLILFGNPDLTLTANRMILEARINYIKATKRFD